MIRPGWPLALAGAVCLLSSAAAWCQQDAPGATEPKTLRELIDAAVHRYQVYPDSQSAKAADVLTALRWANNTRGSQDGITLLYVHQGRPLAAACVYPWNQHLEHDFESLSRAIIEGRRDGEVVWQPQEAGVVFADIPQAPAPEETRSLRLRQLKSLSERFKATLLGWKADSTDREELRLLSRPLYRYEPVDSPVIDGAVFAFVMGTDPEVLLLIEAVQQSGTSKWQFALARRTSGELEGRLDDKVVWKAPRFPPQFDPRRPHYTLRTPIPPDLSAKTAVDPPK